MNLALIIFFLGGIGLMIALLWVLMIGLILQGVPLPYRQ